VHVHPHGEKMGQIYTGKLVPIESSCNFLLVINSNLAPILHRFRDIAFDKSKIAIFGYPSNVCLTPPDYLHKIFTERSRMTKLPNGIETLPKISIV